MKKYLIAIFSILLLLLLVSCSPTAEPIETPLPTPEPTPEALTAEKLMEGMSIEEKAKQLIMVSCHWPDNSEAASRYSVGALCLYGYEIEGKSRDEVIAMNAGFQALSDVPLIISTDEEGGGVHRISNNPELYPETFRSPPELRDAQGLSSAAIDTRAKCVLMEELGFNVNLAPICDVALSSGDYIYERCFSMDYEEAAVYITSIISAMNDYHVGSVLKHFPGYGGSADTHMGVGYDSRELSAFENGDLLPFRAGIEAGADAVMVSHNIVACMDDYFPASLSPEVHRVLREDLGFDGVIITDDLGMGAILRFADKQNMAVQALLAGNDMLCCTDFEESVEAILTAVEDGTLTEERINESVLRILDWKIRLGLFNEKGYMKE